MERDHGPPAEGAASFHTTRWTIVMSAAQSQAPGGQSALAQLCRNYWYPLYMFARRRGHSPDDAQDLTQGFFLHLLEHRALTQVDQLKGKFRSFLLASFQNYLSNESKRARCFKRGSKYQFVSLNCESTESRYLMEPVDLLTGQKVFDAPWAMTLLNQVMIQSGKEYAAQGKSSTFEALTVFLRIGDNSVPSYEEVAKKLEIGVPAVKTLIHRLRKQDTAILREEVARTVSEPGEIDGEIHALCDALIVAEGRLVP